MLRVLRVWRLFGRKGVAFAILLKVVRYCSPTYLSARAYAWNECGWGITTDITTGDITIDITTAAATIGTGRGLSAPPDIIAIGKRWILPRAAEQGDRKA
jgi:hypothetical protein